MLNQLTFTFLVVLSMQSFGQDKRTLILGKVTSTSNVSIENIHILNKNSKKGTISDTYGHFSIPVKENDTLLVSAVHFYYKEIVITKDLIEAKRLVIDLLQKINELEEVEVKAHNLLGNLTTDAENVEEPKSIMNPMALDFSMIDFSKPVVNDIDNIDRKKPPPTIGMVDPAYMVGVSAGIGFGKYVSKENRKLNKLKQQDELINNIRALVTDTFIINYLGIQREYVNHFIEYSISQGANDLFKQNRKIEMIDLLIELAPEFKKQN